MKTIIQKDVHHINSEELAHQMYVDFYGNSYGEVMDIFEGNTLHLNNPIKIETLRIYLNVLEEKGANYVAIDFHSDHDELELDGILIKEATEEEIEAHNQKEKDFQINFIKERIRQYSTEVKLFQDKLKELTGE